MSLTDFQRELCETSEHDFGDLRALVVNCTLKPSPERSHTQGLIDVCVAIMEANGVAVDQFRAVDHDLAAGVYPDMREHGAASDEWPALYERVQAADVRVVATPIWLGEKSSVCTRLIERLYGISSQLNEHGQYAYYGKVGGCLVTGNEDGIKHSRTSSTRSSTSATRSRRRRTRAGSERQAPGRAISTKARAGRRTTSPTGTRPS